MTETKKCPNCDGSGAVADQQRGFSDCPKCDGSGTVSRGMHEKMTQDQRQALGTGGGLAAGFAAGGPIGAVIGGGLGYLLSSDNHDDGVGGN
ncbi:hypothetical protein [Halorubrum trueperi]|uniref:Molecular chaperone DnaJ n=1 Tax=Halorubrum trueperi TaxID=2004704 RepID=A0ABD5UNA1_9EURY